MEVPRYNDPAATLRVATGTEAGATEDSEAGKYTTAGYTAPIASRWRPLAPVMSRSLGAGEISDRRRLH